MEAEVSSGKELKWNQIWLGYEKLIKYDIINLLHLHENSLVISYYQQWQKEQYKGNVKNWNGHPSTGDILFSKKKKIFSEH